VNGPAFQGRQGWRVPLLPRVGRGTLEEVGTAMNREIDEARQGEEQEQYTPEEEDVLPGRWYTWDEV